jgi:hypothetical protein
VPETTQTDRGVAVRFVGWFFLSFQSLLLVEHNSFSLLPRIEEALWRRVRTTMDNEPIIYGDHGIVSAIPRPGFRGSANIRYTIPDQWFVERGAAADKASQDDFLTLASHLREQDDIWRGPDHCPGCSFLEEQLAEGRGGNATRWREAGFAHHFAVVSESLHS